MRKNYRTMALRIIFVLISATTWPSWCLAMEDAIVAIVNNDVITFKDLQDYLNSVYVRLRLENRKPAEIQQIMDDLKANGLKKLIQDRLILDQADRSKIQLNGDLINQRIEALKGQYPSEAAFMESLLSEGYTLTDLRNKIRDQLKIQQMIEQDVRSKIYINPQEVTDYYEQHRREFQKDERLSLDSIFISSASNSPKAQEQVNQAYGLLSEGRNFKEVAKEFSEMPSVGVITKGQLRPDIEEIIFLLKVDGLSPIVKVENGFYIFKLLGKMPAQILPLEDVKNDIQDQLFEEKFQKKFSDWINDLEKKSYIEIKE